MKIYLTNIKYEYEIKMLLNNFSKSEVQFYSNIEYYNELECEYIHIYINDSKDATIDLKCDSLIDGNILSFTQFCDNTEKGIKNASKRLIYDVMSVVTGKTLPWGILTGIRPVKIINELKKDLKFRETEIKSQLQNEYYITDNKIQLMDSVSNIQSSILSQINKDSYSIYVAIPFCPSRCNYCSFFSNDIKTKGHLADIYLDKLEMEIEEILSEDWAKTKNIDSIYIGGGTPTTLSADQIERLLSFLKSLINFSLLKEITFEAGRPDTIDELKLKILKKYGVTRISINPQTMVDSTLKTIGRGHNSSAIENAFNMARKCGFDNINMDIILGLTGETIADVKYTIEKISQLKPESITMHTLSIKKSSKLVEEFDVDEINRQEQNITAMIDIICSWMTILEMNPYYLYRQKNILGGFENVGFSLDNRESWYNIVIMEEVQNILAFGAGGVSRFIFPDENRIERVSNNKNLERYIEKIEESINKKKMEMK